MTPFLPHDAGIYESCRAVLQAGLGLLIQSTLLLVVGLAAGARLSSRSPALRCFIYRSALVVVATAGVLSVLLSGALRPLWSLTLPPARTTVARQTAVGSPSSAALLVPSRPRAIAVNPGIPSDAGTHPVFSSASRAAQPHAGAGSILYAAAVALWAGGSVLLLGWLLVSHIFIERLRRSAVPVRDGAASPSLAAICRSMGVRPPLLLSSRRVQSPFLTGILRPAILLPAGHETEFDEPAIRAILIHELTHLVRRDCMWRLLARIMGVALWPQPLLWLLTQRLAQVGEELCDEAVLQGQVSPHLYAACLLRLAERLVPLWPERAAGLGVVPFRSSLGRRIEQILDGSRRRPLSLSSSLRVVVGVGAAGAVVAGLTRVSAAAPRPARPFKAARATKSAEKPGSGPVSGRVVSPDGKPVAGATVSWIGRIDETPTLLASVKTDDAGQFRFADTTPLSRKDDFPQLLVEAESWGLTFPMLQEDLHTMEISLNPATEVSVRFLDPGGKPVADRKVSPTILGGERGSYFWFSPSLGLRFSQTTDATGAVTFRSLPQGYRLGLSIADERFASVSQRDQLRLSSVPVTQAETIRLQPGATISGRVTIGPGGKPVAGIKVGAQGMGPSEGGGDAISNADGQYRITGLPPGAYNVALSLKDPVARSWTARAHEGVSLHEGEHREGIDFALIEGAVIRGRVVAEDNGEPIPGIHIGVYGPAHPQSGAWVQGTQTGPDGTYLHRVPAGKQHLYISMATAPPGFLLPANRSRELTVRDAETLTIDFKLPRGARIQPARGRVVGPDGKPVANAEVALFTSGPGAGMIPPLRTNTDGVFTVNEQYLSQTVTLRARRGDLATPTGTILALGREATLRLQKNALVSLGGRIADAAGRPIAGAPISLVAWIYDSGAGSVVAQTDSEGRYRLTDLWPDFRYSVDATAKGFGHKYSEQVQLRPGESRELPPIVLKVADRTVAGRVVNEQGDPVVGAQVNINGRESPQEMRATDGEGRFRFDVVDEPLSLQAWSSGYKWAHKKAQAGDADVILVLSKEATQKSDNDVAQPEEQFQRLRGRPAPALQAVAWLNSAPRSMAQLQGKVVLIDFWAIGCGPCVASLPGVQRAAEQFAGKGLVVIGLHSAGVSRSELQAFARKHGLTYPLAIDAADGKSPSFGKTFRQYAVQGIPTVAVIDRSGRVAYLDWSLDEAIGRLGPLLAQSHGGIGSRPA